MNEAKEIAEEIKTKSKRARSLSDEYRESQASACKSALAHTRKVDWKIRLGVINHLLGMHGTEAIRGEWQNGYWADVVAVYCNTGDTYALTVIHVRGDNCNPRGKFIVSSLGDWFERNEKKLSLV